MQEDRFTTIHIEELTCMARDTKLGAKRSRRYPHVGESAPGCWMSPALSMEAQRSKRVIFWVVTPKGTN